MFPVTGSTLAAASSPPLTSPLLQTSPSLRERIDEIAQELLKIEANYPKLMTVSEAPKRYTEGKVFHSAWLYTLYLDLVGFFEDPEDRDIGVSLLLRSDGELVYAPAPNHKEADEIRALIARTDKLTGLFPEEVDEEISSSPEEYVVGFRQEAVKAQLAFVRLYSLLGNINEHNIRVKNSVSTIIVETLEGKLEEVGTELDRIDVVLSFVPDLETLENKYQHLMENTALKVVQVALCILEEIGASLPPMNEEDVADPSAISHKSRLDQRCASFYQQREFLIVQALELQKTLLEQVASRKPASSGCGSAASTSFRRQQDTSSQKIDRGHTSLIIPEAPIEPNKDTKKKGK